MPTPNERPEDELYERWTKTPPGPDREKLLEELTSLLRKNAFAICWIKLNDFRPDIVNEAVYRATVNLDSFRGESKLSTWFHSIVRNLCMTEGRTISREPQKVAVEAEALASPDATEAKIELAEIRSKLEPGDQELLDFKLAGLTEDEIAEQLQISRKNVCYRWAELRKRIVRDSGGRRA